MDKIFVRNFIVFGLILISLAIFLVYSLVLSEKDLGTTDDWVFHTHNVIIEAEELSRLTESMLAAQRGYLLTGDENFLNDYQARKAAVSEHIASLTSLVADNSSQLSRLDEIRNYFNSFSQELELRASEVIPSATPSVLHDVEVIDGLRDDIMRINSAVLSEEYKLLNRHVDSLEYKKRQYFNSLIIGVFVASSVLLLLNWFLLNAQRKRTRAEETLKDTEGRFALAVEGAQDGIFDWDLRTDSVFYSKQFFNMLGYDYDAKVGKTEDFKALLNPEDAPRVWDYVGQYLNGELSEYDQSFRMKHESGRWVWIQARAKSLLDKHGKPYRIVGAHTDISHIVKTQEKLENEKKEAVDANQAKSDFLAHMSHEIRTPLTAISGIAEIFEGNMDSLNDKQKQLVSTLSSSTTALKDLITDLLDFSKIESGEIDLVDVDFSLSEMFQEVISIMSLKASEKGLSFVFDYHDVKEKTFIGDKVRIRQVLINLVGNAIKFTDEGSVRVRAFVEDRNGVDFLRVDVVDTGLGISSENFDLVFERFKQADASVSRKYGGTGLGLPISKNLVRLMGGNIFLNSELGNGSTFSMLLPMRISEAVDDESKGDQISRKLTKTIQAALSDETKILLVEDYEGNVVVISHILEEAGLCFDVARNGEEAVEKWSEHYYDLILMDVQMPKMDGFAATAFIRKAEENDDLNRTPIIGMTAHALVGDKDKCIKAGMDAYLPKPIVDADLKRLILKFINLKRLAA